MGLQRSCHLRSVRELSDFCRVIVPNATGEVNS